MMHASLYTDHSDKKVLSSCQHSVEQLKFSLAVNFNSARGQRGAVIDIEIQSYLTLLQGLCVSPRAASTDA